MLNDPEGLFDGTWNERSRDDIAIPDKPRTLYPDGFSMSRLIEVIESEAVWDELA